MILTDLEELFTLTTAGTQTDPFWDHIKAVDESADSTLKEKWSGRRYVTSETIRITESEFDTLSQMLGSGTSKFLYTPTVVPGFLTSAFFPMQVSVGVPRKKSQVGGGEKRYKITLNIRSSKKL